MYDDASLAFGPRKPCWPSCVRGIDIVDGERKIGSSTPNVQIDALEDRLGRQEE